MTDKDLSANVNHWSVKASISERNCNHWSLFCVPSKPGKKKSTMKQLQTQDL